MILRSKWVEFVCVPEGVSQNCKFGKLIEPSLEVVDSKNVHPDEKFWNLQFEMTANKPPKPEIVPEWSPSEAEPARSAAGGLTDG
jgi:hypothetical protein